MASVITIEKLSKTYKGGVRALDEVDLTIEKGEILALLGPNGAGKTTLIGAVCGLVRPTSGRILVEGHDAVREARRARSLIGLVPQELSTDAFESVMATVRFSRGLFGKKPDPAYLEALLRELSLWDKRDAKIMQLSGGMKRRVLIAKALSHEPEILFLDEPTAGVDVELRREMWKSVEGLRARGVTIILTTHYLEEAEKMADRIGVIDRGKLLFVENKAALMTRLSTKQLTVRLNDAIDELPTSLEGLPVELSQDGLRLVYTFEPDAEARRIPELFGKLAEAGLSYADIDTRASSLEEIFIGLIGDNAKAPKEQAR